MSFNTINGTTGNDVISGTAGQDEINGLGGDDFISGLAGDDILNGHAGVDFLRGQGGNDILRGGGGDDSLDGMGDDDTLYGGPGNDTLSGGRYYGGGDGEDHVYGGDGDDVIFANGIAADSFDHVFGGAGDDEINIHFSQYVPLDGQLHGDDGFDTLIVTSSDSNFSTPPAFTLQLAISGPDEGATYRGGTMALSGIERIEIASSVGDDDITGGAFDDIIDVREGANTVDGGAGDDRITYRDGAANTIEGGDGIDTLEIRSDGSGGAGGPGMVINTSVPVAFDGFGSQITGVEHFIVFGSSASDRVMFGDGDDSFEGRDGTDTADGGAGDDSLVGGNGKDTLYGDAGDDHLIGGIGNIFRDDGQSDTLFGEDGNDTLEGGEGADFLYGGAGSDVLVGGNWHNSTFYGDKQSDLMRGGAGNDVIHEGFTGGFFQGDRIFGEAGNDIITIAGHGGSTINGGGGIDTLEVRDRSAAANDDKYFSVNRAGGPVTVLTEGYTLRSVERLVIETARGDDTIEGGDFEDVIDAGLGNNTVQAFGGDDLITVESGPFLLGGSANSIDGGDGEDTLFLTDSDVAGLDFTASGNSATDGNGGTYENIERFDILTGEGDDDVVLGSGRDRFRGKDGDDTAEGGGARDILIGGRGDDILSGGDGHDILVGVTGYDVLTGGEGQDAFRFGFTNDAVDDITDFESGIDRIQIRSAWLGVEDPGPPTAIAAGELAFGAATSPEGQFVFTDDGPDGTLAWDADGTGSGAAVEIVRLLGVTSIDAGDIFVM